MRKKSKKNHGVSMGQGLLKNAKNRKSKKPPQLPFKKINVSFRPQINTYGQPPPVGPEAKLPPPPPKLISHRVSYRG